MIEFKEIAAKNAPCSAASTGSSALKFSAAPKGWVAILSIVGGQTLTRPLLMHAAAKSRARELFRIHPAAAALP